MEGLEEGGEEMGGGSGGGGDGEGDAEEVDYDMDEGPFYGIDPGKKATPPFPLSPLQPDCNWRNGVRGCGPTLSRLEREGGVRTRGRGGWITPPLLLPMNPPL